MFFFKFVSIFQFYYYHFMKYNSKTYRIFCFVIFFISQCLISQNFHSDVENYTIDDYKADNQNWNIDINNDGVIFIANNKGLLRYNGQAWQLFSLPNLGIVRSVLCWNNKVFTGSFEEFGYWEKDEKGDYKYTSLVHLFKKNNRLDNVEFWQIILFDNSLILNTYFNGVYRYDGNSIEYISDSKSLFDITSFQQDVFAVSLEKELNKLKSNKHLFFQDVDLFTQLHTKTSSFFKSLFLYSAQRGGEVYTSSGIIKLSEEMNELLKTNVLNQVLFLNDTKLVFGTVKNGVYIYDINDQLIKNINKKSGLCNNTVLGMRYSDGLLWLALDNGVSRVSLDESFFYYFDDSGKLGTVYDLAFFNKQYFLGSNTGLYTFNNNQLKFISGTEGQVWDLTVAGDDLIVGHNDGTFIVDKNIEKIDFIKSPGVFKTIQSPFSNNSYLQATYYGLYYLEKKYRDWSSERISEINFPLDQIVLKNDSILWGTHQHKGLYKIIFNKKNRVIDTILTYDAITSPLKKQKTWLNKVNSQVLFYNNNQWFQSKKDTLEIVEDVFQNEIKSIPLLSDTKVSWHFSRTKDNELIVLDSLSKIICTIDNSQIKRRLVTNYEKIRFIKDSLILMNLNDGFVCINKAYLIREKTKTNPKIEKLYTENLSFDLNEKNITIPYSEAQFITVEVFIPFEYNKNQIGYQLKGKIHQKSIVFDGKLQLQNLPYGDYEIDFFSRRLEEHFLLTSLKFRIAPPWYLSLVMKIFYFFVFVFLIIMLDKRNKIKLRKESIKFKKQYVEDTRKKIAQLEKVNLKKEIANKRQELSNSTSLIIKKNELLIRLSSELKKLLDYSPNKTRTSRVIEAVGDHIDKDADWQAYEARFNELNQDLLKRISKKYPKLTLNDLKICAYIKSGLTSREIAPLMGITFRAVELKRYRLRKKLNIQSGTTILEFLCSY